MTKYERLVVRLLAAILRMQAKALGALEVQAYPVAPDELLKEVDEALKPERMTTDAERILMNELTTILAERRNQHGDFRVHAAITQRLKTAMMADNDASNYPERLSNTQCEALEMIQHKIGRILAGDPNHIDHWDDVAGYATLVANELREAQSK